MGALIMGHVPRLVRWLLFRILAVGLGLGAVFLGLEAVLRIWPQVFSYRMQNLAFSKYDPLPDGMYFVENRSRMFHMKRNFRTDACFNGHCWTHQTDEWGFRNPPGLENKDVLLLGDSMIYGHGVNEEQTVGHFLRTLYGHNAYNMARQGDCLYNNYVLLRMHLQQFKPKYVLLFVFLNDFSDLENRRARGRDLLERMPEVRKYDYDLIRRNVAAKDADRAWILKRALFHLHAVRFLSKTKREVSQKLARISAETPAKTPERGHAAPFLDSINDPARFERLGRYYETVLEDLRRRCRAQGARLVVVNLHLHKPFRGEAYQGAQRRVQALLTDITRRLHIPYRNAGKVFRTCGECYLERDGHLSETGHRVLAEFLHETLLASSD